MNALLRWMPSKVRTLRLESAFKRYKLCLRLANRNFQRGKFREGKKWEVRAARIQSQSKREIPASSNWSFCGDEILGPIGHSAIGLHTRYLFQRRGLLARRLGLIVDGNEASTELTELWKAYWPHVVMTREQSTLLKLKAWPLFEKIAWVETRDAVQPLYRAVSEVQQSTESEVFSDEFLSNYLDEACSSMETIRKKSASWHVVIHLRTAPGGRRYGRNIEPELLCEATRLVQRLGGQVVCIGDEHAHEVLGPLLADNVVQVPTRRDFHLAALATARLVIASQSGPGSVANLFGRPVLQVNTAGLGFLPYKNRESVIPRRIALPSAGAQSLSLAEMHDRRLLCLDSYLEPRERDARWVSNSSEEICLGLIEMLGDSQSPPIHPQQSQLDSLRTDDLGYRGPRLSSGFGGF